MLRLSGRAISGGAALGAAAVVRWEGGIAQLPARILEEMARVARKGPSEPIEVILVSEDYARAASLTIPGVRVVGIVAEGENGAGEGAAHPALVGVEQATAKIGDDVLVLLDGDRGMALVDPDGATVAAYQAERERIAPRLRLYIDYAHEPARTLDGRLIRIHGVAATEEAVSAAAAAGADGIILFADASFLPVDAEDATQRDAISQLFRAAAGKPVTLLADLESLSVHALLQAARAAETTLALPLGYGAEGLAQAREYLEETGRELSQAEVDWRPVRLAGVISPDAGEPPEEGDLGVHRLLADLSGVWDVQEVERLEWLDRWISAATREMASVDVILPAGALSILGAAVALGATGAGVAPEEIQAAKELLRETDTVTLRGELLDA